MAHTKEPVGRLDTWINRVAAIAQVGLLAATIWGFFYTVIPLYQKAALDEVLARREQELKVVTAGLTRAQRQAYELNRRNSLILESLRTPDECSKFRVAMAQPDFDEDHLQAHARSIDLDWSVKECLDRAVSRIASTAALDVADSDFLRKRLATVGQELDQARETAARRIAELPKAARLDSSLLQEVGPMVAWQDDLSRKLRDGAAAGGIKVPLPDPAARFQYRLQITQASIARDFRLSTLQRLRDEIGNVWWPVQSGGQAEQLQTSQAR